MNINNFNFVFWGTPDVASNTLEILKQAGFLPSLIVTSPDAKKGRGMHMEASPVAFFAEKNNIPCLKPVNLDKEFTLKLSTFNFQLFVVVAYGKIIPEDILGMPKSGSINIHYSLLPKYRGASPVETAILNGETETGVTIQKMAYQMDTGAILAQEKTEIGPDEKAPELKKRLIQIGGKLLVKILPDFVEGKIKEIPQDESKATFCKKIKKEDGLIDPATERPSELYNKFRAYATWPRIFFFHPPSAHSGGSGDKRVIITDAVLENNQFIIKKVIPEGGKETDYKNYYKN